MALVFPFRESSRYHFVILQALTTGNDALHIHSPIESYDDSRV